MSAFEQTARAHIASRRSTGTRELYSGDLKRWLAYCAEHKLDIERPTPDQAAAFRDELVGSLASQTVRRMLSALSRMYRHAVNTWPPSAAWNPFDADALQRPPASDFAKTAIVSREEADRVFAAVEADPMWAVRDTAILLFLYDTGVRVSAVANLLREKLYRQDGVVIARIRTKHKDEVEVELTERVTAALDRWLIEAPRASKYVFPSSRTKGRPIGRRAIYSRFLKYGHTAGVPRLHPHCFRATYITEALDAGVPLHEVQAAVHHSDPGMTQRYDRGVRGKGVAAAVAKFRKER